MKKIPVEDRGDIYRDSESSAIISQDISAYEQRKRILKRNQEEKNEINNLKDEVSELKSLLRELIEKGNS